MVMGVVSCIDLNRVSRFIHSVATEYAVLQQVVNVLYDFSSSILIIILDVSTH